MEKEDDGQKDKGEQQSEGEEEGRLEEELANKIEEIKLRERERERAKLHPIEDNKWTKSEVDQPFNEKNDFKFIQL